MSKLLIASRRESVLSGLLAASFDECRLIAPEDIAFEDLDAYDAFAVLGGTDREGLNLLPPSHKALDQQIRKGKPVFAEYVVAIGQVSFLEPKRTRYARPVLINPHAVTGDIARGTILDEQSNSRLTAYKGTNRTRPILQYVKSPHGYYAVDDADEIKCEFSQFALWQDEFNLLVCSFRLCDFSKARFAPRKPWATLISGIIAFLGGRASEEKCLQAFERVYSLSGSADVAAAAMKAMDWFENADMLVSYDGAPYSVKEGLAPDVYPDGEHGVNTGLRNDCTGETALAFFLKSLHTHSQRDRAVSDGLYRMILDMQITEDCPQKGMVRGGIHGWWNVSYQDDTSRGFLLPLLYRQLLTGDKKYQHRIMMALDYLLATTGTDGLRSVRVDFYDQYSDVVEATGMHTEHDEKNPAVLRWRWGGGITGTTTMKALTQAPANTPSAHYNAFYLASLLLGYRLTGEARYYESALKGVKSIMNVYPWTAREHSETQELCRLILPLTMLYWISGADDHKGWLYQVARDLQRFRHPGGGYIEWDTNYTAACAGVVDGESSVLCENGNPVMDLLYSLNWLPMGFIMAYYVTGDRWFKQLWEELTRFLASIQIASDDKLIDGVWTRAFDADIREVYGVPNDIGWAPWSVESGWTMGEIASGMFMGLIEKEAWPRFRE